MNVGEISRRGAAQCIWGSLRRGTPSHIPVLYKFLSATERTFSGANPCVVTRNAKHLRLEPATPETDNEELLAPPRLTEKPEVKVVRCSPELVRDIPQNIHELRVFDVRPDSVSAAIIKRDGVNPDAVAGIRQGVLASGVVDMSQMACRQIEDVDNSARDCRVKTSL